MGLNTTATFTIYPTVLGGNVGIVPNAMLRATESYIQLLDDASAAASCGVLAVAVTRAEREKKAAAFEGCRMMCTRAPSTGANQEPRCGSWTLDAHGSSLCSRSRPVIVASTEIGYQ
jgi:hypothetical protein